MAENELNTPAVEETPAVKAKNSQLMISGRLTQDEWDRLHAVNAARRKKGFSETPFRTLIGMFNTYEEDDFGMFYTGK